MQVDLFSDSKLLSESNRIGKQVQTRGFAPVQRLMKNFPKEIEGIAKKDVMRYTERIQQLVQKPRNYAFVGEAGNDNLWEAELLGLGNYAKEWMVLVDFSNALDFIMEIAFNCKREECRKIPNYEEISRRLMNYDFEGCSDTFDVLFFDSEIMTKAYVKMLNNINNDINLMNLTQDEKMAQLVFIFYSNILQTAAQIKDYVATFITSTCEGTVYRSKTFSSIILTSDHKIEEELILTSQSREDYVLKIRSFHVYDWAREGIANEISRNSYNR